MKNKNLAKRVKGTSNNSILFPNLGFFTATALPKYSFKDAKLRFWRLISEKNTCVRIPKRINRGALKELGIRKGIFLRAFSLAKTPVLIAMFVTPIRFFLELAGLPENAIFIIGLLWLTLVAAVYWGFKLFDEDDPYQLLLLSLVIFSPISRIPVFVLWWITTTWELGTHYNIFDNWVQALVGQLVYGSLVQIIPGFLLGSLTLAIMRYRKSVSSKLIISKK